MVAVSSDPTGTGDVHIGNAETTYAPDLVVEHKGFVNGSAALAYMTQTFPDAEHAYAMDEEERERFELESASND